MLVRLGFCADFGAQFAMMLLPFLHGPFDFPRTLGNTREVEASGFHGGIQLLHPRLQALLHPLHIAHLLAGCFLLLRAKSLHQALVFLLHDADLFAELVALAQAALANL